MAAYVDFEYYTGTYRGSAIAEADFPRLALRASTEIDNHTFYRAGPVVEAGTETATIDAIKMAACAVAEEIQRQDQGGEIQSERVGQHSVTYAVAPARSSGSRIKAAMKPYLWPTFLMYQGLNEDE